MATTLGGLSLEQLAGNNQNHYANLWRKYCDLSQQRVAAQMGAALLKTSGLPEGTLRGIWELSDHGKEGTLDQKGFYLALHLIALAQSGTAPKMQNVSTLTPPPRFQDLSDNVAPGDWAESEKKFLELPLQDGFVSGNSVKPMMLSSGLPAATLARIWQMVDTDSDGKLRTNEFCVAMFLIKQCSGGALLPQNLPSSLFIRPSALPSSPGAPPPGRRADEFVISASSRRKYEETFRQFAKADTDLITGAEAREVFKLSKLPVSLLADIWNLCSKRKPGFLCLEEFCLAMLLIEGKIQGRDLPPSVSPDFRLVTPGASGPLHPARVGPKDYSSIKELDTFENEVKDLDQQVVTLVQEVSHTQSAIEQKTADLKDIQGKLSNATTERMQLERRRSELSSRVEELDRQNMSLSACLQEVQERCRGEEEEIRGLERQLLEKETIYRQKQEQLGEMNSQLSGLKEQQSQVETQVEERRQCIADLTRGIEEAQGDLGREQIKLKPLQEEETALSAQMKQLAILEAQGTEPASDGQILNMSERDTLPEDYSSKDDALSIRATAGSSPVSSISNVSAGSAPQLDEHPIEDEFRPARNRENGILRGTGASSDRTVKFADQVDQISRPDPQGAPSQGDPFNLDPFAETSTAAAATADPFNLDPFSSTAPQAPAKRGDVTFDPFQNTDGEPFSGGINPFVSLDQIGGKSDLPTFPASVQETAALDPFQDASKPDPFYQDRTQRFDTDPFGQEKPGFGETDPFGQEKTGFGDTDPFGQEKTGFRDTDHFGQEKTGFGDTDPFGQEKTGFGDTDHFGQEKTGFGDTDPFGQEKTGFGDTDPFGVPDSDPFNAGGGFKPTTGHFDSDPFGNQGPDPFQTDPFTT